MKNFVVRTLWERCEFSKSASRISDDEDYIERFMFEKRRVIPLPLLRRLL